MEKQHQRHIQRSLEDWRDKITSVEKCGDRLDLARDQFLEKFSGSMEQWASLAQEYKSGRRPKENLVAALDARRITHQLGYKELLKQAERNICFLTEQLQDDLLKGLHPDMAAVEISLRRRVVAQRDQLVEMIKQLEAMLNDMITHVVAS